MTSKDRPPDARGCNHVAGASNNAVAHASVPLAFLKAFSIRSLSSSNRSRRPINRSSATSTESQVPYKAWGKSRIPSERGVQGSRPAASFAAIVASQVSSETPDRLRCWTVCSASCLKRSVCASILSPAFSCSLRAVVASMHSFSRCSTSTLARSNARVMRWSASAEAAKTTVLPNVLAASTTELATSGATLAASSTSEALVLNMFADLRLHSSAASRILAAASLRACASLRAASVAATNAPSSSSPVNSAAASAAANRFPVSSSARTSFWASFDSDASSKPREASSCVVSSAASSIVTSSASLGGEGRTAANIAPRSASSWTVSDGLARCCAGGRANKSPR
mmetsp:Transcript_18604/g.48597  ORF Transcript_18604/g.48597 Transcript_18604/m.48597 type:complete len:342 (+) Transcript_18604:477-1502(+)